MKYITTKNVIVAAQVVTCAKQSQREQGPVKNTKLSVDAHT